MSTESVDQHFGNSEVATNAAGGKQSKMEHRFDLIDADAIMELAHVLWYGATRYGEGNWKLIPTDDHINHALYHLYAYLGGVQGENHLAHAFTRVMFAMHMAKHEWGQTEQQGEATGEPLYSREQIVSLLEAKAFPVSAIRVNEILQDLEKIT